MTRTHITYQSFIKLLRAPEQKYLITPHHSCPIPSQHLSPCPLFTHAYSIDTSALANINSAIFGFFFQKLLFMCSFTDYKPIDCKGTYKNIFRKENLVIVPTQHHAMVCPSLIKDKNTFFFSNTGWKGRRERMIIFISKNLPGMNSGFFI